MADGYQVLYRKYRPKIFAEVVGQEHIVQTLQNAVRLGKVGHAYLFAGPRGTGKTTLARLLAKAVNCLALQPTHSTDSASSPQASSGQAAYPFDGFGKLTAGKLRAGNAEPCNTCGTCITFLEGRAIDLIEIDAASNRGIDEIRNLREAVRFSPVSARYKVYIIDETHMLTKEAFNALLKMLEEPPPLTIFILATTEVSKVPETVRSRCQRFDFGRLPFEIISARLHTLCTLEDVRVDPAALALLARLADGSARDAESLLDQVLSTGQREFTHDDVCRTLGFVSQETLKQFLAALLARDTHSALLALATTLEQESDPHHFLKEVIQALRDSTILAFRQPPLEDIIARQRGKEYVEWLKEVLGEQSPDAARDLLDFFLAASVRMRHAPLPQLPLELAVIEATTPQNPKP